MTNIKTELHYYPAQRRERVLLHICKCGPMVDFVFNLYDADAKKHVSVISTCDDGTGGVLKPAMAILSNTVAVHVVADMSTHGINSMLKVARMLENARLNWKFLGVDDSWLSAIPASNVSGWISNWSISERNNKNTSNTAIATKDFVRSMCGPKCLDIHVSGKALHLEAFANSEYRNRIRRIVRDKMK